MKRSKFGTVVVGVAVLVSMVATARAAPSSESEPEPSASIGSVELVDSGLEITVNYLCRSDEIDGVIVTAEQESGGEKVTGGKEAAAVCGDAAGRTEKFTLTPNRGNAFRSGEVEVTMELVGENPAMITEKHTIE